MIGVWAARGGHLNTIIIVFSLYTPPPHPLTPSANRCQSQIRSRN
jgi:hypothetical protein